jgi:hypothetical protein
VAHFVRLPSLRHAPPPLPKQGLAARIQEVPHVLDIGVIFVSIRHKAIGAAVVLPLLTATPALADGTPTTPEPIVTEPAPAPTEPEPTPAQTTPAAPSATDTTSTQAPVSVEATGTGSPAATVQTIPVAPQPKRVAAKLRTSRAGATMRTIGTRYSPVTAVFRLTQWARQGRGGYHNGCLRLVDNAYGASNRVGTALRQRYRAKRAGFGHTNRQAPIGAQLFWRTSNPAGHIATYVGRGLVVTNMPGGRVKMVPWRSIDRWGPYLGWAEPYYG